MKKNTSWFCAHVIFYYENFVQKQSTYLVNESIYLLEAGDWKEAEKRAEDLGFENQDLSEDGHLELNEEKVRYRYAGVRKVIEVERQPDNLAFHATVSGVEISYSEFEVDTLDEVRALAKGEMVGVLYRE